ncbi:hypothetical protein NDU88_008152 [Pleurodeles waltl]|uniref:Uncharacterized protein n=1 Tax=Pleurodeles waltl TaxID=8319 RepID=A0AAV7SUG4_PLEWA|nr:hypothetical protein NDU88_008152 [Pleurodeles waltl]
MGRAPGVPPHNIPLQTGPPHPGRDPRGLHAIRDLPQPCFRHLPGHTPVLRPVSGARTPPGDIACGYWLHDRAHKLVFLKANGGAQEKGS